jgi:foldase protein PrsA
VRAAPVTTKRRVAAILAAALVIALVVAGVTSGLGHPSVPDGDAAIVDGVDGGTVSKADVETGLTQAAVQAGLKETPPPDDPQYPQLLDQAMQSRLFVIWVRAEAADRGISVTDEDIAAQIKEIKSTQFSSPEQFDKYVKQTGLSQEDIDNQVESDLLQEELAKKVVPSNTDPSNPTYSQDELADIYGVDDDAIQAFYDANPDAFAITASRDVRVVLNTSKAKVEAAKKALEADDSDESWKKVAAKYSQDQASKQSGGLLQGLVEGSGDPQLEKEVFAADEGELVGPFKTDRGYYVIQVDKITEAGTAPLNDKTKSAIEQQLITARQQEVGNEFRNDFIDKWTQRTTCAPEYMISLCRGYTPPATEPVAGQPEPPPVVSTQPIAPGDNTITVDGSPQQGLPQGPQPSPSDAAPTQLPAGSVPIGPDGAPAPSGTTPPPTTSGAVPPASAAPTP